MPTNLLWLNGETMPIEEGRVGVEDRGFLFSDGIYEVVLFYDGRPFMMREHLERWEFSARGILLHSPGTLDQRAARIAELVERSGHRDAMVYGQLTRGASVRNHLFPSADTPPTEMWFVRPAPKYAPETKENGVALITHADERWAHCEYKTISLLPNCLAKEHARRAGAFEALLHREGVVTECSASNAWCVRDGVVFTHPISPRILCGITRMAIIEVARACGVEVREQAVGVAEFRAADEAFISSTTMEVMPATKLDHAPIGDGRVGPVTKTLMAALRERVMAECEAAAV